MADSLAFTSVGTTLSISAGAPATYDAAGFASLSFTNVGEISDLGSYGGKATLVTFIPLQSGVLSKRKGSVNQGTLNLKLARAPDDAGQTLLIQAANSTASYAFKIVLQDGTTNYFQGVVMGVTTTVANADAITMFEADLEVTTSIIEV